jgi:multicomponent K+:H+ antiporter subunit G
MNNVLDLLATVSLLIGAGFVLVGSIGLVRLPDIFARLHGPSKATTLGLGGILFASMLHQGARGDLSLRELAIALFLFLTAPVVGHLVAKAALRRRDPTDRAD